MTKIRKHLAMVALALCVAAAQAQRPDMLPYTTIDRPEFVAAAEAAFLQDDYIVLGLTSGRTALAFPAADLAQHGSAMVDLPDGPVTVTWCGVCNVGAVYRRTLDGRVLHFDYDSMVAGNEVQKDRETGSRWQQAIGEAIDGPLKGKRLKLYPFTRTTWGEWRRQHPETRVLKPLPGYAERLPVMHRISRTALLGEGEAPVAAFGKDYRVRPRELVAGLTVGTAEKAYPVSALRTVRVVNDHVGGVPVLVVHQPDSGTTTAFEARVNGRTLSFEAVDESASVLRDTATRSQWTAYGRSTSGALKGTQLKPLVLLPGFWFAWSQFRPKTELFTLPVTASNAAPLWETLLRAPLPADAVPKLTALRLHIVGGRAPSPPHQHAGPVFAYLLSGRIENEVEPNPPRIYEIGGYFYEAPMKVHRRLLNLSATESAEILVFMAGDAGANTDRTALKVTPLANTKDQELTLQRLTLAARAQSASRPHTGPALVYVVSGAVEVREGSDTARTVGVGEVFVEGSNTGTVSYRNVSEAAVAKLLVYAASDAGGR
jgi:hypothetical protein